MKGVNCMGKWVDDYVKESLSEFDEELLDERGEGVRILIDAEERLIGVFSDHAPKARSRRIDEHQIGRIEQAVCIVHQLVGSRRRMAVVQCDNALGPKGAHMQPNRR